MTKIIKIGNKVIGGGNKILIQSMCNTKTQDANATINQINELSMVGCDIIRVTVPDELSAKNLSLIKKEINIPLVADIHFDYKLAILSAENGADKIRINPGNIGNIDKIKALVSVLKERKVPIRIGVNSGSIEKDLQIKYGNSSDALVESALTHVKILEDLNFYDICISVKASSVLKTFESYTKLSKIVDYPLHLGVTEAGLYTEGIVKSSIGIGSLLLNGIGDTIRVSLTGNPLQEIFVAKEILKSLNLIESGIEIVACPTCGRTEIEVEKIAKMVIDKTKNINKKLKIAVMGCVVNGIGEGKDSDIGIAGGKEKSIIFIKGEKFKTVNNSDLFSELMQLIDKQ